MCALTSNLCKRKDGAQFAIQKYHGIRFKKVPDGSETTMEKEKEKKNVHFSPQRRRGSLLPYFDLGRGLSRLVSMALSDDVIHESNDITNLCSKSSSLCTPYEEKRIYSGLFTDPHDEIRDLCNNGQLDKALKLLFALDIPSSMDIYISILKLCSQKKSLHYAKQIHSHLIEQGIELNGLLCDYLVVTLANCSAIEEALDLFLAMPMHSVFSWTAIISAYAEVGFGEEALKMLPLMQKEGVEASSHTFVSLFKACGSIPDLEQGKRLHIDACKRGFTTIVFIGNTLVSMYGKCGAVVEAESVFGDLFRGDVVTWNVMLVTYLQQGDAEKVIMLYRQMQQERVEPDQHTFVYALQACGGLVSKEDTLGQQSTFHIVQALHADAKKRNVAKDVFVGTALLGMYGKVGDEIDIEGVFGGLHNYDVVSWNAMMSAYIEQNQCEKALLVYRQMQVEGMNPNELSLVVALKACSCIAEKQDIATEIMPLEVGQALHIDAQRKDFASDSLFGTVLLSLYGKCGALLEAEDIFSGLVERDIVSWNVLISTYVQQGYGEKALLLYRQMYEHMSPDEHTLVSCLQACGVLAEKEDAFVVEGNLIKEMPLEIGMALHASIHKQGVSKDIFISNTLVSMYGKCGTIMAAEPVFAALPQHDVVSWNSLISAYVQLGWVGKAVQSYKQMQREGISPDHLTYVTLLQACGIIAEKEATFGQLSNKVVGLDVGLSLYADVVRKGFASDVQIVNTIISMYGKCGAIHEAEYMFSELKQPTIVSWTAMLSAYVEQGLAERALEMYSRMHEEDMSPNELTFVIILQACGILAEKEDSQERAIKTLSLERGHELHSDAFMRGYELETLVGTLLLTMYGKCGVIIEAENAFNTLPYYDINSWNALFSIYVAYCQGEKALEFYKQLDKRNVPLDDATYISLLHACCETSNLELCYEIHFYLICARFDQISSMGTTLIHAYGSCGNISEADAVLDALTIVDVVSWTSCISVHVSEGMLSSRKHILESLYSDGIVLDDIMFTSVLAACSHSGLVFEGLECFESLSRDFGIAPGSRHYSALVDLLGRAGDFLRIEKLLERMPMQQDPSFWLSLLGSCRLHGNMPLAKEVFNKALKLQPKQAAAACVLMSNITFQDWVIGVEEFSYI